MVTTNNPSAFSVMRLATLQKKRLGFASRPTAASVGPLPTSVVLGQFVGGGEKGKTIYRKILISKADSQTHVKIPNVCEDSHMLANQLLK